MFRFVSPSRHQYILQADVPEDADLWMTLINYASVFRTSGLHIRTKRAKNGTSLVPLNSYGEHESARDWLTLLTLSRWENKRLHRLLPVPIQTYCLVMFMSSA